MLLVAGFLLRYLQIYVQRRIFIPYVMLFRVMGVFPKGKMLIVIMAGVFPEFVLILLAIIIIPPRASVRAGKVPKGHRLGSRRFCFDRLPLRGLKEIELLFQHLAQCLLAILNARRYRCWKETTLMKLLILVVQINPAASSERVVSHLIPTDAANRHAVTEIPPQVLPVIIEIRSFVFSRLIRRSLLVHHV